MADNKDIQLKITAVVTQWELNNYAMFYQFLEGKKRKTETLADKFASVNKGDGYVERLIHEVPEALYGELAAKLSEDDLKFFTSREGALWFAKTFPQYRVAETI